MSTKDDNNAEPAINIARTKLDALYKVEPDAKEEIIEASTAMHRSKHQRYMQSLSTSGKSLAEIQTAWHNYYVNLPDEEKNEVWQEFYAAHGKSEQSIHKPPQHSNAHIKKQSQSAEPETVADVKQRIIKNVSKKPSHNQHLHSMIFGLGMGAIVMMVMLFGFFNERFIAPFITPSRAVSSTPIIVDPNSSVAGPESEVIIPKINVEIPVVYDVQSIQEKDIQNALERGVVHYASTPEPGQKGNVAIVGHSSNNIFNQGKYKFAFVLLNKLEVGDTFYLTKAGTRYAYKIYEKKIVKPTDVSVLGPSERTATATLITCDPPGTSVNRLIVIGEQISPDPNKNTESSAVSNTSETSIVPGNAPSLWQRIREIF